MCFKFVSQMRAHTRTNGSHLRTDYRTYAILHALFIIIIRTKQLQYSRTWLYIRFDNTNRNRHSSTSSNPNIPKMADGQASPASSRLINSDFQRYFRRNTQRDVSFAHADVLTPGLDKVNRASVEYKEAIDVMGEHQSRRMDVRGIVSFPLSCLSRIHIVSLL